MNVPMGPFLRAFWCIHTGRAVVLAAAVALGLRIPRLVAALKYRSVTVGNR